MSTPSLTLEFPHQASTWLDPVSTATALPATAQLGAGCIAQDTGLIYGWDGTAWVTPSGGGGGSVTLTLVDSSGGATGVTTIAPATLKGSIQYIKKTSTDANTITLTPPSGTIGDATQGASYTFSTPGQVVGVTSDGTNTYVVS